MKQVIKFTMALVVALAATGLYAEGTYVGIGGGLMFNLGQLGGTITNDGLQSSVSNADTTFAKAGSFGCGTAGTLCPETVNGTGQYVIMSENRLIALSKSTNQAITVRTEGAMSGGLVNLFYQKDYDLMWMRAGVMYNKKIMGGDTSATIATVEWYHVSWDFKAMYVPVYVGLKANVGDSATVYMGGGINYFTGGWDLYGKNLGDIPTYLLGTPVGAHTVRGVAGNQKGGDIYNERVRLRVKGFAPNFVVGVSGKIGSGGDKLFFEMEDLLDAGYGVAGGKNDSTRAALGPITSKITVVGGAVYKFGYMMKM
ncbi:MAG: porin OmpL1 [Spirochaetia bacterium]|nr:porin OmpL1 [Spirochaetia bacterium]